MCTICAAFRPFIPGCDYTGLDTQRASVAEIADAAADAGTAYHVDPGDSFLGTLSTAGDRDWIAVSLVGGQSYDISLTGITLGDPYLRVHDGAGGLVASNDDISFPGNVDSALSFTALATGTYYLSAGSFADLFTGNYRLDITDAGGGPTDPPAPTEPTAPVEADHDEMALFLTEGFWGGSSHRFDTATDTTITVDITALTAPGQQLARWALEAWEAVADITFQEVVGGAGITFDDDQGGAFASYSSINGLTASSHVNVSTNWIGTYGTGLGSYSFQTYVHEVGHALGLGHMGPYDGNASFGSDNAFTADSWQVSVMSYFSQSDNTATTASEALLVTPMIVDIIAIQELYGAAGPGSASAGNTVWGEGATLDNYLGALFRTAYDDSGEVPLANADIALTITDIGGRDTLDLSSDIANQRIDLRPETHSDVNGLTGNLSIARGTVIEEVLAGNGNDAVTGNDADNTLVGGAGDDLLNGLGGADRLEGGAGEDTVSYEGSRGSLRVDLLFAEINTNVAAGDSYDSIEHLVGSQGFDNLRGTFGDNYIFGAANVDYIFGRAGDDHLVGGIGDDVLFGGVGADVLVGGIHRDRAQYSESQGPVLLDLADPTRNTGEAAGDSYEGIEDLAGGSGADTILGDAGGNRLFGREGADALSGRGGDDYLNGGSGADTLAGGAGDDTLRGGAAGDTFVFDGGHDLVEEFHLPSGDRLALDAALWSGPADAAALIAQIGRLETGTAVLDFGPAHSLTLDGITTLDGLAGHIDFI